jgi:hypothetical protein
MPRLTNVQRAFLAGVRYGYQLGRRLRFAPNVRARGWIKNSIDTEPDPDARLNSYVRRQEEKSCQSTSATCCVSPGEKNEACLIE